MLRVGIGLAVLLWVLPAQAQDDARAKVLYQAGVVHYEQGELQKALEEFESAYKIAAKPALLYNIAQCHDRLNHVDEAIEHLRRYLKELPDAPDRAAVEAWLKGLEARKKPAAPPATAPVPTLPPTLAPPALPALSVETPAPQTTSPPPWYLRWWPWAGIGAVVVGGVVAAVLIGSGDASPHPARNLDAYDVPLP